MSKLQGNAAEDKACQYLEEQGLSFCVETTVRDVVS